MITLIGIVLLLIAVAFTVVPKMNEDFKPPIKAKYLFIVGGLVLVLGITNPVARNIYGYRQVVENPLSGKVWVRFNQGWYWKGPFSTTTEYPNVVTIIYANKNHKPKENVSFLSGPTEIRFSDAAKAMAEATVKWRLPNNPKDMLLLHKDNRTSGKVTETVLEPYTKECLEFAAQLMESETHYSGGKSKMAEDFQDQLEEGQYIIVTKTEYVPDDPLLVAELDSLGNPVKTKSSNKRSVNNRKITTTDIRRDKDGRPKRKKSNIKQYNIRVVSATIKSVDYDKQIDKKLAQKIEASTQESISKQLAITAQQEAITAKAQGAKLVADAKAKQEAEEETAVIIARKERKVAEENVLRDKAKAASVLALKRAQAEGDRLKVQAGLIVSPLV